MAVRIPWDKYETAVLLDACLRVDSGTINRLAAITYVSNTLRNRAINRGLKIDAIFRNENGISMQYSAMMNCLHHKLGGFTISKIFHETVELYESDKESFNSLVWEAIKLNSENIKEKTFASWLKEQDEYTQSMEKIIGSLNLISVLCLKERVLKEHIVKMNSVEKVSHVLEILYKNEVPHIHSKKQLQECIYSVKAYLRYVTKLKNNDEPALDEPQQNDELSELRVNFANPDGFAFTRPDYFQFDGSDAVFVKNWTKLYVGVVNELCSRNSELLESLNGKNISGATRIDVLCAEESGQMTAPYVIKNGLAIETNLNASDIVKKIKTLLDLYGLSYDSLTIVYHKRKQNTTGTTSAAEIKTCSTPKWIPQFTDQVTRVLENHYSYGFRMGSPIEMMRFRNYAEIDSILIPDSDEQLEKEIVAAGTNIDGKIFVFGEKVLRELDELVNFVFDSGAEVLFIEPFMDRNAEWLEEHCISSAEMLKKIISKKCLGFYYGQNMITPGEKKTEHEAVVSEIHRVSEKRDVIWFTDLCEQLPFVPSDKIAWSLSASDDFVWISEGKYFVMEYLVIDDCEIVKIRDFVARECNEKGYASIADLPFGSIPEQNFELSITALYSAVYIAALKGIYQLKGKILTRGKNDVDIVTLLKDYCKDSLFCSVAEVMDKAVELVGVQNRQNSFVALYDTMIRVNKEQFVSNMQVQFDVDKIDCVLQDIIGDQFAPIQSVTTFALFPPCGQNWNHYLLESFCYRFSRKYQLYVLNYNDKNVGIIASKSLNMSYSDILCEAVAKADVSLTAEAVGQFLFENGWMAKRKFANLPEIIEKATTLREGD